MPSVPFLLDVICDLTQLVHETATQLENESEGARECGYWTESQKKIYEEAKSLLQSHNRKRPEDC